MRDILANLLTLWFFATPIIYSDDHHGAGVAKRFMNLNPFAHLVDFVSGDPVLPGAVRPLEMARWRSAPRRSCSSWAATWLFDRLRDSFAEEV